MTDTPALLPPSAEELARMDAQIQPLRPSKQRFPSRKAVRLLRHSIAMVDRLAKHLLPYHPNELTSPERRARPVLIIGLWLCFLLFGVVGTWAAFVPLSAGAIAPGKVVVDSNRRDIQHLEGGIIDEILVRDGDEVKAGQVLIRMDPTTAKVRNEMTRWQWMVAKATESRLIAERDEMPEISFLPEWLTQETTDKKLHDVLQSQRHIFSVHRDGLVGQTNIMNEKIAQSTEEIRGLQEQIDAANTQIGLLNEEIKVVKNLLASGNALRPRLLALQRQQAQLVGQRGQSQAMIARANQTINEAKSIIINQKTESLNHIVSELKDTQVQLASLEEQTRATSDVVRRIEVVAPVAATVTGLSVHTTGGVVQPGQVMLSLVPLNDKLIIEAHINPTDIDVVHAGLKAQVRLTALHLRYLRAIEGTVTTVSADRLEDPRTGQAYYLARIEIPPSELNALGPVKLTPGMPAETLIVTGKRTMLSYIIAPLSDSFSHAFREE